MCHAFILVDSRNPDGNSAHDIADALRAMNCVVDRVDEERHLIEAAVPSHELSTIHAMDGVVYVRSVCHYLSRDHRVPA